MPSDEHDPTLDSLRGLPLRAPPRDVDQRVLSAGRAAFRRAHSGASRPVRFVERAGEFAIPALLAGTAAVYLTLALRAASALYR
jgi:hypothetical protein